MTNEIRLNKKFFSIIITILIVLIITAVWVTTNFNKAKIESKYSAVYLVTGEIYFGELHRFPQTYLSDAWLLQRNTPTADNIGISILPFNQAFWGPTDKIYLNPDQIVFTAKLRNDSQVKELITGATQPNNTNTLKSLNENPIEVTP